MSRISNQKELTEARKQQANEIKWSTPYYTVEITEDTEISLAKGNDKLGGAIWAFNLLPGSKELSTKDLGLLTDVKGTCQGCCEGSCESGGCYAISDAVRHHNACIPAYIKNTLMMRADIDNVFSQLKQAIEKHKIKTLRYHSSGEIETYQYLLKMVELAQAKPNTKFYFYTKRTGYILQYLNTNGRFPENLVCNISVWHNYEETKKLFAGHLKDVNFFIYDDGDDDEIKHVKLRCKAVEKKPGAKKGTKTGVTCSECTYCYTKNNGHDTCVDNH